MQIARICIDLDYTNIIIFIFIYIVDILKPKDTINI